MSGSQWQVTGIAGIERAAFVNGFLAAQQEMPWDIFMDLPYDGSEDVAADAVRAWDAYMGGDVMNVAVMTATERLAAFLGDHDSLTTLTWPG